jgi:hypothetical protein
VPSEKKRIRRRRRKTRRKRRTWKRRWKRKITTGDQGPTTRPCAESEKRKDAMT